MKRITGGESLTTRQNYGTTFEFTPQFTLVIVGNSRPPVEDDSGGAMTRRLVEVPFPVPAGDRRDDSLKVELCDPARSGAAILRWAAEGCTEWQQHGLMIPEAVRRATDAYWTEQEQNDPVRSFLAEHFELTGDPSDVIPRSHVSDVFRVQSHSKLTAKAFVGRLRADVGLGERKVNGIWCWEGLKPLPTVEVPAQRLTWDALLTNAEPAGSTS